MDSTLIKQISVWLHIITGGAALIFSVVPLVVAKGSTWHKKAGKTFVASMLAASVLGGVMGAISQSWLLAFVGALAIWHIAVATATLKGNGFVAQSKAAHLTLIIGFLLILAACNALQLAATGFGVTAMVLGIFSAIGLGTSIGELRFLLAPQEATRFSSPTNPRLRRHVGHSMGAFISCWSAFLVVNQPLPHPLLNWLGPTAIGTIGIVYWSRKVANGWKPVRG